MSRRRGRRLLGAAAVAARVHRRGERERPVEGVLQDGQRDPADRPEAGAALAPQHPGAADPLDALGELRRHRDRDDDGGADLVQGAGQGAQQPLGVGQGVGRADAGDQAGEPQPLDGRGEHALEVERAEQGDAGQLDAGQRVEPDGAELVADQDVQHDPQDDDERPEHEVEPERPRPRRAAALGRDDQARDAHGEQEQQGVARARAGHRQPDRPHPPGDGVQVTGQRCACCAHGASTLVARRRTARYAAPAPTSPTRPRPASRVVGEPESVDRPPRRRSSRRSPSAPLGATVTEPVGAVEVESCSAGRSWPMAWPPGVVAGRRAGRGPGRGCRPGRLLELLGLAGRGARGLGLRAPVACSTSWRGSASATAWARAPRPEGDCSGRPAGAEGEADRRCPARGCSWRRRTLL